MSSAEKSNESSSAESLKDKFSKAADTLRSKCEQTFSQNDSEDPCGCCKSLTRQQRLWGFLFCFTVGYLISFASTLALLGGSRDGARFALLYSLGNLVSLFGSGFLVGPSRQLKLMMKPVRRYSALAYVTLILVVLLLGILAPHQTVLILLLAFLQCLSAIWYTASYIPFGRKMIESICSTICRT